MTTKDLVNLAVFTGILLTNIFIIILFVNAIIAVIRIKKGVKKFFDTNELKQFLDKIFPKARGCGNHIDSRHF